VSMRALLFHISILIGLCSTAAIADSVQLIAEKGIYHIPVVINEQITLNFVLDSGAADVSIPEDVVSTLIRTGTVAKSDILGTQTYELADGSSQRATRFRIKSLRIGSLELHDVVASTAPASASLLLGQSFLARLKSWSIDNQAHRFVFNEPPLTVPATKSPPAANPSINSGFPVSDVELWASAKSKAQMSGSWGDTAVYLSSAIKSGRLQPVKSPDAELVLGQGDSAYLPVGYAEQLEKAEQWWFIPMDDSSSNVSIAILNTTDRNIEGVLFDTYDTACLAPYQRKTSFMLPLGATLLPNTLKVYKTKLPNDILTSRCLIITKAW
jgi:clan AA aspartic protease (TIGR02281 family)